MTSCMGRLTFTAFPRVTSTAYAISSGRSARIGKVFAEALVPKPRPGRSGHTFFDREENAWILGKLHDFYLNQAQHLIIPAARDLLLAEIAAKQKVWGIGHITTGPHLGQCRTALNRISKPVRVLARQGEKVFNDQCGMYNSRNPDTLRANDLWVTDQRQVDVRLRDGGEHLGRIWMVSFLDVATDKVCGYGFGPVLSSDVVMMAATMAVSAVRSSGRSPHGFGGKELLQGVQRFDRTSFPVRFFTARLKGYGLRWERES